LIFSDDDEKERINGLNRAACVISHQFGSWFEWFSNTKKKEKTQVVRSLEQVDEGTISSVIQSTNQSCVPSSRPGTNVHPKGKDTRSNPEHKLERKR